MFDLVIVGGGSAGCVLANRLSSHRETKVLLLEAGGPDDSPLIPIPAMSPALQDSRYDWRYRTVPQPRCNMRRYFWPRGRTLGGSSAINYMIYVRGHAEDYNGWRALGDEGWGSGDRHGCPLPRYRRKLPRHGSANAPLVRTPQTSQPGSPTRRAKWGHLEEARNPAPYGPPTTTIISNG
jgi:choline dehydrogenase-like flavoprotein